MSLTWLRAEYFTFIMTARCKTGEKDRSVTFIPFIFAEKPGYEFDYEYTAYEATADTGK